MGRSASASEGRLARLIATAAAVLATVSLPAAGTTAATAARPVARPTEHQVKAAFLYNFARFAEWPARPGERPGSPFVIAIVGDDPFGRALEETVADKTIQDRPVVVRRGGVEAAQGAHIAFISGSEAARLGWVLERVAGSGVLTVGETPGYARRGVTINFVLDGNRVRFEINPRSAEQAGLKLSSQLLKLATLVPEGDGQ